MVNSFIFVFSRSVFVPYFQYFLTRCVQLLASGQAIPSSKPRKKSKVLSESILSNNNRIPKLTSNLWHLRYLIVSDLHKCFLYDNVGFLDNDKFQVNMLIMVCLQVKYLALKKLIL